MTTPTIAHTLIRRGARPAVLGAVLILTIAACGADTDTDTDNASTDTTATATASTETETSPQTTTSDETAATQTGDAESAELFPDVVGAVARRGDDGTWTFDATLSSPYDSAARYADAWRVVGADGTVYGIRELAHDHGSEQPFTRSQSGISIPDNVTEVTVEGRDQISGWGGATMTVTLEQP